jgi:redox-sensitive bicupin YhaK (pirin superfamily)
VEPAQRDIQTWVALPEPQEDAQESFEHHGKESLPLIETGGVSVRLILGRAYGKWNYSIRPGPKPRT